MNKAKIMLNTVLILSVFEIALAFNIQKFGNSSYCYLTTEQQPAIGSCTFTVQNKTARPMGDSENFVYYTITTTATPQQCALIECPNIGVPDMQ